MSIGTAHKIYLKPQRSSVQLNRAPDLQLKEPRRLVLKSKLSKSITSLEAPKSIENKDNDGCLKTERRSNSRSTERVTNISCENPFYASGKKPANEPENKSYYEKDPKKLRCKILSMQQNNFEKYRKNNLFEKYKVEIEFKSKKQKLSLSKDN